MNYKRITVRTFAVIAAALCVILAISVFCATIKADPYAEARRLGKELDGLEQSLTSCNADIADCEAIIAAESKKLPNLEKEADTAEKAYKKASAELDAVCSRNYYSSILCEEEANCEALHEKVSSESSKYSKAEKAFSECSSAVENAQSELDNLTKQAEELKSSISEVSSKKSQATTKGFFFFVAALVAAAGFIALAKFLLSTEAKKVGYIACALMAAASFIYILLPTKCSAFTYVLGMALSLIFYALISGTTEKRVTLRVIAIIVSAIVLFSAFAAAPFICPLYVLTMILVAMVLVPCVYTEYLDIAKHIFYSLITFGIWNLIWTYNTTENLNKVEAAEKRAPVRELLLYMFLPLYNVFWTYKTASITELYGAEKGKIFKIEILCLAFCFVCPFISSILIQDKTNLIVGKPEVASSEDID